MPNDAIAIFKPAHTTVSQRIRERLLARRVRFFASDNIASCIEPGELDELVDEVGAKLQDVLESLLIDTGADHNTRDTGRRVVGMFIHEVFNGRDTPMPPVTEFPNASALDELMIVGPITVRSACSHHLCLIIGKLRIGVMPNKHSNLIGLSKYARIAQWIKKDSDARMTNSVMQGSFRDDALLRREFLSLIRGPE